MDILGEKDVITKIENSVFELDLGMTEQNIG